MSRLKLICRTSPSGLLDPWHPLLVRTHPFLLTPQVSRAHMRVLPVCGSCPSPLRLARLASQDSKTSESLMVASLNGHLEVVERLIAAGAKVEFAKVVSMPLNPSSQPHHPSAAAERLGRALRHGSASSLAQQQLPRQ